MSRKSTICLGLSLLLLCGCATTKNKISPFPAAPEMERFNEDYIIKFNEDNTCLVRQELVDKAVMDDAYLELILGWKKKNKIE